ncbi:MAG: ribosome silencing factor [Gemmatimonadetes bacterium]|nr:ribosome silencing factor [Gemmatimonadota bacterium]
MPSAPQSRSVELPSEVARACVFALELKAVDVVALDLRGLSSATDFFVIASGMSDVQVKAVADHVIDELKKEGVRPEHVEGRQAGRWVLIDYVDFVVHVFHQAAREFYQLEMLWGDAPQAEFEP